MIVFEIGHFDHITYHEFATQGVDHVIVVEGDKQGITIQEQSKLGKIKIYVLCTIHATHDKYVGVIHPVTIFQQQQIFYEQGTFCAIGGYGHVAGRVGLIWIQLWTKIFVHQDINAAHSEHFADVAVKILVIIGPVGAIKAESRHSLVFMG